ncbi:MAG: Tyrosine--tRNA ligase [Candidatus Taylorbacteria bacterium]|nr:Tyrosine--tRNA ligase [Candidatus Taylorbacteria bacterium]
MKNKGVITDAARIDAFLTRGVENIFPKADFVRAKMLRGEQLTMYYGIDPTGPNIHLGHLIPIRKLAEFQQLGHKIYFLIGDFTATIGDPDKASTRKVLTRKQVLDNCRHYQDQASKFISFSGPNRAELKYNSTWLGKLGFAEVLELASKMTVQQMLKRDMFELRMKEGSPIHIHEFMYPLMQGYDSVAMDVDGEIGGNDQTWNMLAGRDLLKSMKNKDKFVIAMKLLTDPSGKKMGKTENNAVSLDQTPEEMFGRIMSWSDSLILPSFEICTDMPMEEIESIRKSLESGTNPRDAKVRLAKAVVTMCHDAAAAEQAFQKFEQTFKKGEMPADAAEASVAAGTKLADILVSEKIVASKGEFRRLIEGKGVSEFGSDEPISDPDFKVDKGISLRIGKKRFVKISIK